MMKTNFSSRVNFNNLNCVSADHWRRLCSAVASKRGKISHLSAANCELTDARAKELAEAMREAGGKKKPSKLIPPYFRYFFFQTVVP